LQAIDFIETYAKLGWVRFAIFRFSGGLLQLTGRLEGTVVHAIEAGLVAGAKGESVVVNQVAEGVGEQSFDGGGGGFIVLSEAVLVGC
jgi:hypothetical protein